MKNSGQTAKSNRSRSFTQEMQQAFVDWVKKLPFIKKDLLRNPAREEGDAKSAEQASVHHPRDGGLAGPPLDRKG